MSKAFHTQTLAELAAGLEKGDFSSLEITQALLDRIQQLDGALNAFVTVTGERALAAAKAAGRYEAPRRRRHRRRRPAQD